VELYKLLEYQDELECILPQLEPGTAVLELGCGVGRLTRPMLDRGLRVTAVDNSKAMVAEVPTQARVLTASIEDLDLPEPEIIELLGNHHLEFERWHDAEELWGSAVRIMRSGS
jgi:cyclopropane fatty-acyl-phospholipid synthase-like methyltransferase